MHITCWEIEGHCLTYFINTEYKTPLRLSTNDMKNDIILYYINKDGPNDRYLKNCSIISNRCNILSTLCLQLFVCAPLHIPWCNPFTAKTTLTPKTSAIFLSSSHHFQAIHLTTLHRQQIPCQQLLLFFQSWPLTFDLKLCSIWAGSCSTILDYKRNIGSPFSYYWQQVMKD